MRDPSPSRLRPASKPLHLLAAAIAFLTTSAFAADSVLLRVSDLLKSPTAREIQAQPVTLYWGNQPTQKLGEVARMDNYTRWSISRNPFGGSEKHCVDAFEQALRSMVNDAVERGYDAIVGLRAQSDSKTTGDPDTFYCKPGYRSTEVSLTGAFAMTPATAQSAAAFDTIEVEGPPRPPWEGSIYVPLEPILNSTEAKAILGSDLRAYWGAKTLSYSERYGPENYKDSAKIETFGKEGACKQAVLKVLQAMADYARESKYDSIIRIRSYMDDQYTPTANDVECSLGRWSASVVLRASLAKSKP